MDAAPALRALIGQRVRHEREARGWTLDGLAGVSGVSRRMLISIEHGEANPSIGVQRLFLPEDLDPPTGVLRLPDLAALR